MRFTRPATTQADRDARGTHQRRAPRQASAWARGFTLIELIFVVAILGVLTVLALPALVLQQKKAVAAANNSLATSTARACVLAISGGDVFEPPANVSPSSCAPATSFSANLDPQKASAAVATVTARGGVALVVPAAPQ